MTLAVYAVALIAAVVTFRMVPDHHSVLYRTLMADLAGMLIIFVFSYLWKNSSLYDPYWSVAPPIIFGYWLITGPDRAALPMRNILLFLITLVWGVRLTVNWALSWPGLMHEDWRYRTFRKKFRKFYWPVSFLAIHLFPTLMVFLTCIPVYLVLQKQGSGFGIFDILAPLCGITAVFFEWKGDLDLRKHRHSENRFQPIRSGLWKYSRHPNYFGEILFWFSLYLFALGSNIHNYWSALAPSALLCLFLLYSIPAMEKRLIFRRKSYREVQRNIPELFPLPRKIRHRQGKPLSDRKWDLVYVVVFFLFACTSFITDSLNGLNPALQPDSPSRVEQVIYSSYAALADPNLIANPPIVRISAGISAFIWGPLYIFFIICFIRGWNAIRNLGFLYGCALTSTMILYMADALFGANPSPMPLYFILMNLPYLLVPLSMIFRMWSPRPFGRKPGYIY